jgi:peptidoglycan/xylan/chitin deacetylase (PgdA/CDA1 family)
MIKRLLLLILTIAFIIILNPVTDQNKLKSESGIILTFDDRSIDDWYSFLSFNNKYGAKATFYISHFHKLNIKELTKLKVLQDYKNEIGYHTLNHLNAKEIIEEESLNYYIQTEILPGIVLMEESGFQVKSFAYPFGVGSRETDREILNYFKNIRYTSYPGKDKKIKDMNSIYLKNRRKKIIEAVGIDNGYEHSLEEIFEGIDRAHKNNEIIILYGHAISDNPGKYNISKEKLEAIIKHAYTKGMKFYTVFELDI